VLRCEAVVSQGELLLSSIDSALENLERESVSIRGRIKENSERIDKTRLDTAETEENLSKLSEKIRQVTDGRENFEIKRQTLMDGLSELRSAIASLDAERETTLTAISQLEMLKTDITGDSDSRIGNMRLIEGRNQDLSEELELKEARLSELRVRSEELRNSITDTTSLSLELEGKRTQMEKAGQEKNRELLDMERQCAKLEQKKLAADMEEKQIIDKLWDNYELSHSAAQQLRQPVENLPKAGKHISELKREINSLGNPNIGAIEEYERVNTRYTFLTEQRDDVEKAKRDLQKIITDITREMEEIFTREFKAIDESFRTTFLELFGGGRAALVLEDEDDVLGCGIEIKVQPPGKALSTLSLLSGGEMAFVAIALYFAILKVRPTPFCVMDEIEAALDESNVIRYAEYMRSMSVKTQFIVITHRRGTMEEADMLYGVTMQEKGVSSVISVDLEEAEKTIA
jgi:Chromosome segregation ATPases